MKRLFALVLSFCMALSIGVCAAAAETPLRENENGVLLSSLDYEECRNFLLNQGVSIPEELSGIDLPKLFADLESNPDMVVSLGWTTLADFIEEVRFVVKSHYSRHEFVLLQFFNKICQRSVALEGIDFRIRISKEEPAGIQRLGIEEGGQRLYPGQQCRILRR